MDLRKYPIKEKDFVNHVEPYIQSQYKRPGRPEEVSHYFMF